MNFKKNRKTILLPPAIGDWTTFKPRIDEHIKPRLPIKRSSKMSEKELMDADLLFIGIMEGYLNSLQKNLDFPLVLHSASVEIMTYVDILKEIDSPVAQFKIKAPGIDPLFLCLDMNLANAIINHAVGGYSEFAATKGLTEIEENILEIAVASGIEKLIFNIAPSPSAMFVNSPNVFFDQGVSETAPVAFVKCEAGFGQKTKGDIYLSIPIKVLNLMLQNKKENIEEINIKRLPDSISGRVKTTVIAMLGKTHISAKELYQLEVGDVIVLDSSVHNLLPVLVGQGLHLLGQPGIKNDRICLKILKAGGGRIEKIKLTPAPVIKEETPEEIREEESQTDNGGNIEEETVDGENEGPVEQEESTEEFSSEEMFDENVLSDEDEELEEDISEDDNEEENEEKD